MLLLFWLLFFCTKLFTRSSLSYGHTLRNYSAKTHTLIRTDHRLIFFLIFYRLFFELVLTEQSLQFSLVTVAARFFRRASLIRIVCSRTFHMIFIEFTVLNFKILLFVIDLFIDVLDRLFFFEICMNNTIVFLQFVFFLFFL